MGDEFVMGQRRWLGLTTALDAKRRLNCGITDCCSAWRAWVGGQAQVSGQPQTFCSGVRLTKAG